MAGNITRIGPMTTGANYFEEQIKYHEQQFIAVAREKFPELAHLTDTELLQNKEVNKELQNDPMAPKWSGEIAKHFGLEGQVVDYETWEKVCAGYAPDADLLSENPQTLNNNPLPIEVVIDQNGNPKATINEKKGKRVGTELIFANSKPYSVLCGMAQGDQLKELVEAKNRCLAKIMKDVEQLAYYRKQENGVKTKHRANGIMWVNYNHIDNRGATKDEDPSMQSQEIVSNLAEPHDHSHVVLLGTTMDKDGNLVALDNDLILKEKSLLSAKYEMYMAEELRALGYETRPQFIKGQANNEFMEDFEKGISAEVPVLGKHEEVLVDRFSQRSKQVKANGDGIRAKEINQANKNHKTQETNSELKARWRIEALELTPELTPEYIANLQKETLAPRNLEELTSIPNWEERLIDSFYDEHKEIACREGHFKAHIAKILHQYTDAETALRMAEEIFDKTFEGNLEPDQEEKYNKLLAKGNLTLGELESIQIELEKDVVYIEKGRKQAEERTLQKAKERENETKFVLPKEIVDETIKEIEAEQGYPLREEQREAVYKLTTKEGAYAILSGRAGSGKTSIARIIVRAYEKAGKRVIGLGTSGNNTKNLLAEAGIKEGYNTAQFIQGTRSGKIKDIDENCIFLCDEMGMADGRTWTRLCDIFNNAGACAKFMGESEQMTAIGASGLFRIFEKTGINTSKLKYINRQKLHFHKEATEQLASGKGDIALQTYYDNGSVLTHAPAEGKELEIGDRLIFKAGQIKVDDKRAIEMKNGDEAIVQAIDEDKKTMSLLVGRKEVIATEELNGEKVNVYKTKYFSVQVPLEQSIEYEKQSTIKNLDEANKIAVDLFLKVPEGKTRLIETDTNANCSAINDLVKQGLKAQGKQGEDLITIQTKEYGDRGMAIGDQVIFREKLQLFGDGTVRPAKGNSKKPAVATIENGERGTVFSVDKDKKLITFKMADGSFKSVKFDNPIAINHSYAVSVFSSQGQSIDRVMQVPTRAGSLNEMYVGASRHKEQFTMIMNEELGKQIDKTLNDNPPNENMVNYAKSIAEKNGLEYTEEMEYSFKKTREFLNQYSNKEIKQKDRNGKPITPKAPHPLDRYKDFMTYCIQLQVKKTSFDYKVASELVKDILQGVKELPEKYLKQIQELQEQKAPAQEETLKKEQTKQKEVVLTK